MKTRYIIAIAFASLMLCGCQREELAEPGVLSGEDGKLKFAPNVAGIGSGTVGSVRAGQSDVSAAIGNEIPALRSGDGSFAVPMNLSVTNAEAAGVESLLDTKAALINDPGSGTGEIKPLDGFASLTDNTFWVSAWDVPSSGAPTRCIPDAYALNEENGFISGGYVSGNAGNGYYHKVMFRTKDVAGKDITTPYWMTMQPQSGSTDPADYEYTWKKGEGTKTFYAYANVPASASMALLPNGAGQTLTLTELPDKDILMGYYSGDGSTGDPAQRTGTAGIRFIHPFAALKFKTGTLAPGVTINSVAIEKVYGSGVVKQVGTTFTWTKNGTDAFTDDDATATAAGTLITGDDDATALLLIPQTFGADSRTRICVNITTADGDMNVYYPLKSTAWAAGTVYTYTIGYNPQPENLLPGKFSISTTEYVQFSRGNLFCTDKGSGSYEFSFEESQYDYRCRSGKSGDKAVLGGTVTTTPSSTSGLFQWIPRSSSYATGDWGAFSNYRNCSDFKNTDVLDFGEVFPDSDWTTLTGDQWRYLLEHHQNKIGVSVIGVEGLAIAPDDYDGEISASYTTLEQWTAAENAGIVFLPLYGFYCHDDSAEYISTNQPCYWSSSPVSGSGDAVRQATALHSYGNSVTVNERWRFYGQNVRLVQKFTKPAPEIEFIDLGLPSGTLWGNMNVGATSETDYGYYLAWGEKSVHYTSANPATGSFVWKSGLENGYQTSTYCFSDGSGGYTKYNATDNIKLLQKEDDICFELYGSSCSVPSYSQWIELQNNCAITWKGNGYEFVGPNGKKIFLPVNGYVKETTINQYDNNGGFYWSNELKNISEGNSWHFGGSNDFWYSEFSRSWGLGIRPVLPVKE